MKKTMSQKQLLSCFGAPSPQKHGLKRVILKWVGLGVIHYVASDNIESTVYGHSLVVIHLYSRSLARGRVSVGRNEDGVAETTLSLWETCKLHGVWSKITWLYLYPCDTRKDKCGVVFKGGRLTRTQLPGAKQELLVACCRRLKQTGSGWLQDTIKACWGRVEKARPASVA